MLIQALKNKKETKKKPKRQERTPKEPRYHLGTPRAEEFKYVNSFSDKEMDGLLMQLPWAIVAASIMILVPSLGCVARTLAFSNKGWHPHSEQWEAKKPSLPTFPTFWPCSCSLTFRHLPVWPTHLSPQDKGILYTTPLAHSTNFFRCLILQWVAVLPTGLVRTHNWDSLFGAEKTTDAPALWPIFLSLCEMPCRYGITATLLGFVSCEAPPVLPPLDCLRSFSETETSKELGKPAASRRRISLPKLSCTEWKQDLVKALCKHAFTIPRFTSLLWEDEYGNRGFFPRTRGLAVA